MLSVSGHGPEDKKELQTNVLFHEKITADSAAYGGIHPLVALESHQKELGPLVQRAIQCLDAFEPRQSSFELKTIVHTVDGGGEYLSDVQRKPDFITVTRGPGMRSNLSVGLDMAKGLALAWDVPLLGVHHMQAHALTPRLCWSSRKVKKEAAPAFGKAEDDHVNVDWEPRDLQPKFPFLGVLASGGHTMLISSESLTEHNILAETGDIALGDCLDKAARAILPPSELKAPYGKALEDFAFPLIKQAEQRGGMSWEVASRKEKIYNYTPPARRQEELERKPSHWGWSLGPPLAESKSGQKSSRRMVYSFAGLLSAVQRLMEGEAGAARGMHERRALAREVMRVSFEHLASRVLLHLTSLPPEDRKQVRTVVVSGGVASNGFLRHVLRSMLNAREFCRSELEFPPTELCTDNALMIAWAGMEMYDAGYESELGIQALRKWSMAPSAEDGGLLGVDGWIKNEKAEDEIEDLRVRGEHAKHDKEVTQVVLAMILVFGVFGGIGALVAYALRVPTVEPAAQRREGGRHRRESEAKAEARQREG